MTKPSERETKGMTSLSERLKELKRRERAFEAVSDKLKRARANVTDWWRPRLIQLAPLLGIDSARDVHEVYVEELANGWRFVWSEYFRGDIYDNCVIEIPAQFIDLSAEEFTARIAEIAQASIGNSDRKQTAQRVRREAEEKDKREFERLQKKFATA
jgi:hypothetical protein